MFSKSDKPLVGTGRDAASAPYAASSAETAEMELVEAARSLNDAAWAEIYRRHAQQVYAYIYYRLGDQHTAEDLAADVFIKALAGIKGYAWRGTPLLAWLYRIAHNVTIDHRKSNARRMRHLAPGEPDGARDRYDRLGALDARTDMLNAMRGLTDDQQQVIILRFYQAMSTAEVAKVMAKPEGAVKALQSRGLRSLRRILEGQDEGLETA